MTRIIALTLAIAAGTVAHASDDYMRIDPSKADQIETRMTEKGYDLRKIEMDDGMYEVDAIKNGVRYEFNLDRDLAIMESEIANMDHITTLLAEQGYDVQKVEMDDSMYYEANAIKDGVRYEIDLGKDLTVVKTEIDD
ncbi:PepSY domain-containing protein [Roseovarius sp. MMSF_3281]|uniref:PepSY domain-containing protein n=1 Tax=Roseovarius sp. MMSF_3281 TaxID=3046694 RepID=UPI00273E1D34|nr:PepSY domain-containing protein [Roseovarius sp. MMSF_3281]